MVQHEGHEEYMMRRMREEDHQSSSLTAEQMTIKDMTELQYKLYFRIKELSEENLKLKEKINHYENNYSPMR